MPRCAREISNSGCYHIVFRGVNHQNLFEEEIDFQYMMDILKKVKHEMDFEIYSYCLMTNHVHILLKERQMGDISQIMKKILTKYAMYFNRKYERSGALIANRYKSKPVETDEYFITLIIYIYQNPVRSGMVLKPNDYVHSSYREYSGKPNLVNRTFALSLMPLKEFKERHNIMVEGKFEKWEGVKFTEKEIWQRIKDLLNGTEPHIIDTWEKNIRNAALAKLRHEGFSIHEIERATGISRGIIARCNMERCVKKDRPH